MSKSKITTTSESLGQLAWRKLRRHPAGIVGMILIGLLVVIAVFAPLLAPFNPRLQVLEYSVKPSMFRGDVIYTKNPSNPDQPSILAVKLSHNRRFDSDY
ncbi:MAG: hypothetical protein IPM69_05625 [Ignavibacteria bacterium]|nr:hypothetical protein [Ignavibacteria bacterium]